MYGLRFRLVLHGDLLRTMLPLTGGGQTIRDAEGTIS